MLFLTVHFKTFFLQLFVELSSIENSFKSKFCTPRRRQQNRSKFNPRFKIAFFEK